MQPSDPDRSSSLALRHCPTWSHLKPSAASLQADRPQGLCLSIPTACSATQGCERWCSGVRTAAAVFEAVQRRCFTAGLQGKQARREGTSGADQIRELLARTSSYVCAWPAAEHLRRADCSSHRGPCTKPGRAAVPQWKSTRVSKSVQASSYVFGDLAEPAARAGRSHVHGAGSRLERLCRCQAVVLNDQRGR